MAEAKTAIANKPAWVDLSTSDPAGARDFYGKVFGWKIEVTTDPQYGGYAMAKIKDKDVAGIGPKQSPDAPSAWSVYIGTTDAEELSTKIAGAGGKVVAPAFDVGNQGRMAVFQDPTGAFISAWQPAQMDIFETGGANTFGWAELNARGLEKALPFYKKVFGWGDKKGDPGGMPDAPPYTEFQLSGESIAGGMEMNPMVPAEVPSYWFVYFTVPDIDQSFKKAIDSGATEMMAPQEFPGGRFAVLSDPQGAMFGLMTMPQNAK